MRILVTDGMDKTAMAQLREAGHEVVEQFYAPEELGAALREFDAVVVRSKTKVRATHIDEAKGGKLKLIIRGGVGVDNIDVKYAEANGITVKNTPKASSQSVAELAMGHMFSCARYLSIAGHTMREGKWEKKAYGKGIELQGKTLGIVGFGRIGQHLGVMAKAIGMKVMEDVPYVVGLDKWLGTELNDAACTYLKDFGAATASNGAVGLYHIANLTPEAKEQGEALVAEDAKVYVIDDAELQRVKDNYPVVWKNKDAKPKLCFMGCPHMSLEQLKTWTDRVEKALAEAGRSKVCIPTVFTAAPAVLKEFEKTPYAARLKKTGVITSYICPLMYMNNPLCGKMPVITSSNKLRTYTTARYYTDDEILVQITKGGARA